MPALLTDDEPKPRRRHPDDGDRMLRSSVDALDVERRALSCSSGRPSLSDPATPLSR
jgi:hypothetical protein